MPLIRARDTLELVCINRVACDPHAPPHDSATTMRTIEGFFALVEIAAPLKDEQGQILNPSRKGERQVLPARVFRCAVCGYLELYDAQKTAPQQTG